MKPIGFAPVINHTDGYGNASETALKALLDAGLSLQILQSNLIKQESFRFIDPRVAELCKEGRHLTRRNLITQEQRVIFMPPTTYTHFKGKRTLGITMFETDSIPKTISGLSWGDLVNRDADALVVPSEWCREVFAKEVTVPIEVVPLGFDFSFWPECERNGSAFTFMMYGNLNQRKGADIAIEAFKKAFPKQTDVALVLKTLGSKDFSVGRDGRIQVDTRPLSQKALLMALRNAQVCLFPSKGEGFGMPAVESMATGALVILTNATGLRDLCDRRYNLGIPITGWEPSIYNKEWVVSPGNWCTPDTNALAERMRWAYDNPSKAQTIGHAAAAWVRRKFTMERYGAGLIRAMKKAGFE